MNDLLVASEQVAHHDVRHVALTVVPMAANTFQTKPKLPVVAARFLFLSTGGHWSNAVLNFGHRAEVKNRVKYRLVIGDGHRPNTKKANHEPVFHTDYISAR